MGYAIEARFLYRWR